MLVQQILATWGNRYHAADVESKEEGKTKSAMVRFGCTRTFNSPNSLATSHLD